MKLFWKVIAIVLCFSSIHLMAATTYAPIDANALYAFPNAAAESQQRQMAVQQMQMQNEQLRQQLILQRQQLELQQLEIEQRQKAIENDQ